MSTVPPPRPGEEEGPATGARSREGLVIAGLALALVAVVALVVIFAVSGGGSPETPAAGPATSTRAPRPSTPGAPAPNYPAPVVESFLRSCTAQGTSESVCQCALDKFEAKYPVAEFEAEGRKLLRGKASEEFMDDLIAFSEECASTEVN